MTDLIDAKLFFEEKHVQPGVQLIIAVTLASITLKKTFLLLLKLSTLEKHG